MNKSIINYFLYILVFCSFTLASNAKVVAAISTLKGLVMVKPIGSRKYLPAYKGQMLKSGEWLKTKKGVFVAIVFLDGSNIKIQQETEVKITSYRMTSKSLRTNLDLNKGQAWSKVADQGAGGEFQITTPTAVASVKGTEFDLKFDNESGETSIVVIEGNVAFAGELGTLLVGAMQASKGGAQVTTVSQDNLPSWQKKTDPGLAFRLKPDRRTKQETGKVIKVDIHALNAKTKAFNNSFSGSATVNSRSEDLLVSTDGSSWSTSVDVTINSGRGLVQVISSRQGKSEIIVSANNAESKIISFEYFQTKSQKRAAQAKLASIVSKVGDPALNKILEDKTITQSQITGGGSVDGVLQKLETGEFILDGEPIKKDNGDGTYIIILNVKPR